MQTFFKVNFTVFDHDVSLSAFKHDINFLINSKLIQSLCPWLQPTFSPVGFLNKDYFMLLV